MLALNVRMPDCCSTCVLTTHVRLPRQREMCWLDAGAAPTAGYCDEMSQASMVPPSGRAKAIPRDV